MTDQQTNTTHEYEYKAEMKQLLHLIIHSLYTHPEVFLRELVSNASDALNKVRFMQVRNIPVLDPETELKITIEIDEKNKNFSIEDTGAGMTEQDLIDRIGTVASSGTLNFLKQMKTENAAIDGNLIGQFGVGFYSVFMVADEVTIETRSAEPDSKGYRWKSAGEGKFTIEEIDRRQRGTRIFFTLKEDAAEFAHDYRVKGIVKKYSNFVDFPIYLGSEQMNKVTALWHRGKDDITEEERNEFYKFVSNDFEEPVGHLHLSIEGRVNFKALIFVPKTPPLHLFDSENMKSLHLYSNKVFIQDDCEALLPEYLRFLKGVVDTEDLPLNVSREVTQSSPITAKIREIIVGRVLSLFEEWSKNDVEKYASFFRSFGPLFKTGINTDFSHKERITELLRYESSATGKGEYTSLKQYTERMKPDQKEIYYVVGENRDAVERNPNLEYFRKNDIEVLFFTEPVDMFTSTNVFEYDKKKLMSIEKADLDVGKAKDDSVEVLDKKEKKSLLKFFRDTLGGAVEDVVESKRLVDSVATLVAGKSGMDAQMERMMKMMDKDFTPTKKILEVNTSHPLLANLATLLRSNERDTRLTESVWQVYEAALLLDQNLSNPADFIKRMTSFMERATRAQ